MQTQNIAHRRNNSSDAIFLLLNKIRVGSVFITFSAILFRESFASPIRIYAPQLWYVPDLFLLVCAFITVLHRTLCGRAAYLLCSIAIFTWCLWSLIFLSSSTVFLGARIVAVGFIGWEASTLPEAHKVRLNRVLIFCLAISVIGVFYDAFVGLPWQGLDLSFSGLSGDRAIAKTWWLADGTRRVSGFGVSSTDTSLIIAGTFLLMRGRFSKGTLSLFTFIPVAYSIWLTQQRATTAWIFVLWAMANGPSVIIGSRAKPLSIYILRHLALVSMLLCSSIPFVFYKIDVAGLFGAQAPSLYDRTFNTWPTALDDLSQGVRIILGGGIGSIGEAALFTGGQIVLADNLFLNWILEFGIVFVAFWIWVIYLLLRSKSGRFAEGAIALLALIVLNGITAGVIVGLVGTLWLMYTVGLLAQDTRKFLV